MKGKFSLIVVRCDTPRHHGGADSSAAIDLSGVARMLRFP